MAQSRRLAALGLLFAVLATAVCADDVQQSADASEPTQAGFLSYYGAADVKHLCLHETKKYNCRGVGCAKVQNCDSSCSDCRAHQVYQSDVTCCKHKVDYQEEDLSFAPGGIADQLSVGTCDWDFDIYKCDPANAPADADPECQDPIPMENGAVKIGTVWGTCFLDKGSEQCGHPFCNKMVLSFQGGFYTMVAYAKNSYKAPEVDGCTSITGNNTRGASSALVKAMERTGLAKKMKNMKHAHKASARHSHTTNSTSNWESGVAGVISGTITVTSLERRVEYTRGLLEYVALWLDTIPLEKEHVPGATALVVKPYTYDIVLIEEGKDYE